MVVLFAYNYYFSIIFSNIHFSIPNVFSFIGAVYLLPFFILGLGIKRFNTILTQKKYIKIYLIGFVASLLLQQIFWFTTTDPNLAKKLLLAIPMGLISASFLLTLKWQNKYLIYIGSYSYSIYLFHSFGTSGGRIILIKFGIYS